MTEKVSNRGNFRKNFVFLLLPIYTLVEYFKFYDLYKSVRIGLLLLIICVLYRFFVKSTDMEGRAGLIRMSGLIFTAISATLVENPYLRWIFLFGIVLSAVSVNFLSAVMSIFSYIVLITIFSTVTPEFVADSFLVSVVITLITGYYSDFVSAIYSIITVISFEISIFFILYGLNMEKLISKENIVKLSIITGCTLLGWLMHYIINKNEVVDFSDKVQKNTGLSEGENNLIEISHKSSLVSSISKKEKNPKTCEVDKSFDYFRFLSESVPLYMEMKKNEKLYYMANLRATLAKGISQKVGANAELTEVGAFYAECGRLISDNYIKEGIKLALDNNLPKEIIDFIKEHNFRIGNPKTKETAITMIVSKLLNTVAYFKGKGIKRGRVYLVDEVMDSCLMSGRLNASGLTIEDYKTIKDYLMEAEDDYFN